MERWTEERARAWYAAQPWMVGANYIVSDAINQLEMFQPETWNPELNLRELGLAASIGMNVVRVFLHDLLWQQDPADFVARLNSFLDLAAHQGIRVMPVLFDSCWNPEPHLGPQPPPIPGVHNSGWVQSPGTRGLIDPAEEARLHDYVTGIVRCFANDTRILAWDVWNEPDNGDRTRFPAEPPDKVARVAAMLPKVFAWACEAQPTQPLTSGIWSGNWSLDALDTIAQIQLTHSDIITFHDYGWPEAFLSRVLELRPLNRPILCTEYMARGNGSTFDAVLPLAKSENVAVLNWGLVAGKTQTHLPWDSWLHPYTDREPTVWFHDIFRPDGTPYRQAELDLIRRLTLAGFRSQLRD